MEGWLHCVNSRGQKGLMPSSFVRLLAPGESYPPPASQRNRPPSVDYFSQVGGVADGLAVGLHADSGVRCAQDTALLHGLRKQSWEAICSKACFSGLHSPLRQAVPI